VTWHRSIAPARRAVLCEDGAREIEVDLGAGRRRNLSRIESELIRAFAGAATQLQYLNHQILLGEGSEIDLAGFSQLASTMLRIGSRLGTTRRAVPLSGRSPINARAPRLCFKVVVAAG
jgi:hypothetical protein